MDPTQQTLNLFITYVDKEGPFLKVWGQAEKNNSIYVEQFLLGASQQFEQGIGKIPFENLQVGTLICVKYKDNKYYRARIVSIDLLNTFFVEVSFIDYGNRDIVPSENIRSLQSFPTSFISIPPLATGFIFAEAHCPGGGEWKDQIFDIISKELRYREVQCHLLTQATQYYLIKLYIDNTDIGALFISRGLMQPIPLHAQQAVLLSMSMQRKPPPAPVAQVAPTAEINTYKVCTLEPMQQYAVYVSFVNEGPTHFSVQLQQSEQMLAKLMKDINEISLRMLEDVPLPGTICLARCQEDGNICRAVVTNEVDNQFKVFYVDFGNYETLPLECLYVIPFKYVLPKVMAIRLALNGVEKSTVTMDMLLAFKKFVDNRLLHMKVLPSIKKSAITKCELWDPETRTSALDVINRAAQHAYPEPLLLNRGFTQPVKVSYVFSCNRFYVQLSSKEPELVKLMEDLQISCQTSDPIYDIKISLPCCALFEADQLWYRSEIVDVVDKENVKVRYIDYGNEEVVPVVHLRMVEGELLTVLRPQAIECCLNGYQNMGSDESRDALLEELILEQNFTMKVSEMLGKKALVELIDANNYNVASLLLDKIAASKSQVSPMLVQAGNTLEHRKSSDSSDTYRPQRKPARDWVRNNERTENRNSDKPNEKSWRNDNKDTRNNDVNLNDESSDGGSWRQNNKGFNRNERDDRDRNERYQKGDRPNINDRFNRNRNERGTDNKNNNWSNKENGLQSPPSWSSQGNEAAAQPGNDGWGDSTSTTNQSSFESHKSREDRFGGRKKFEDRGDREDRGGKGGWNNKDREDKGDRGGWNNRDREDKGDRGGWNNKDRGDKDGWNNKDRQLRGGWNNNDRGDRGDRGGWNDKEKEDRGDRGGWKNRDNFKEDRGDRENRGDRGGWSNRDGFKRDGFKKDFKKDGSEMSSSGSEKSFNKGPRTSTRNDFGGGKRIQDRSADASANDSWSVSDVSTPIDAAPSTATFEQLDAVGSEAAVVISWFHNPGHFYCQLQSSQPEFKTLMEEIQQFYKNRKAETTCVVGAPVIGLFPEDNVLYRAQILESLGGQYKVFYVDFGNVSTISKVWPIEKKFMQMPAQAVCCGLGGIGPIGDSWQDPSVFSQFFGKDFFMARFVEKDEVRTYIQLWDDQEEVSQLLVQANLAVSIGPQAGGIEIPLLLNQQFRVVLKSVNNLNDTIVALECGLALTCKAHNLEMASESYEDILKGYLEQTLIIYVDNILENDLLDVTFYDNDGNKLEILTPDEGALDNVEPLCPLLVMSSQINGYVSHANETAVFIQPSEYVVQVADLLEKMYEAYENAVEEISIIPEEGFVYAVHSSDGNWYRGRVDSFDDDKATVSYVDYGNSENVVFNELRVLKSEFNQPNILCLQVTVTSGSALSFLEKDVVASIYYGETGWEGPIEECPQSAQVEGLAGVIGEAVISEEDGELTAIQEVVQNEENVAAVSQDYTEYTDEVIDKDQTAVVDTPQIGTPVYVSHIDSPTQFYVQFTESSTALDELQQQLQDTAETLPVLESISVGVLCAAPYSVDHQWYRAEVLDADEDITTVRFIDYGNTDVINNKTTQVKTLPPNLLTLAVYATRCSLKLKSMEEEWTQSALELFEELANRENIGAEFIIQDEKTNIVELYSNGENVKDALLAQNLAVPCELVTESKTTCFVSHLNSPSEFWVQMENCIDELEWIAEQLSGAEKFPEIEDMSPGTLCAALFQEDEMWYRARILSNTIAGIELLFIDYGNSCVSNSLRQLPEDLLVTPPLAQKCCLQRPEGIPYWTKEAQNKFGEISAEGQTIFEMKKISTGETATVELLLSGENIVSRILPVTEDGCVKDFESLDKFNVERNEELLPESVCLEPMPGMEWDEESNTKFLELYSDGTVFQVELIGEDCVRLYQNGADIRPNLGGVKSTLNLSSTQDQKTDNLDINKDLVIDYEAGGDNLDTKHSIEDSTQGDIGASQEGSEATPDRACEEPEQDSGQVDLSMDTVKDKNVSQGSETDSGHHSEQEVQKEGDKTSVQGDTTVVAAQGDENVYEELEERDAVAERVNTVVEAVAASLDRLKEQVEDQPVKMESDKEITVTSSESAKEELEQAAKMDDDKETSITPLESPEKKLEQHTELYTDKETLIEVSESPKKELKQPAMADSDQETLVKPSESPKKELGQPATADSDQQTMVKPSESPKKELEQPAMTESDQKSLIKPSESPKKELEQSAIDDSNQDTLVTPSESLKKELEQPATADSGPETPTSLASPKKELEQPVKTGGDKQTMNTALESPKQQITPLQSPKKDLEKPLRTEGEEDTALTISESLKKRLDLPLKATCAKKLTTKLPQEQASSSESRRQPSQTSSRSSSIDRTPISHDDKILPGSVSRPHSPLPDLPDNSEITTEKPVSRPSSSQGLRSSPEHEQISEKPPSRPPSSQGRRISHDEKIVPAVLSRPHTPLPDEIENS